jgi:L-asparaginase
MHSKIFQKILVLGTGGTIAGLADDPANSSDYKASQLGITDILSLSGVAHEQLEWRDVAQIDSKDMGPQVWRELLRALSDACDRSDVRAVVITHGTDTVEETAYLLHALGPWRKPLVLTCAMKPANAPDADGPVNLKDALALAQSEHIPSVSLVCAGHVHDPSRLQKVRTDQADAFSSGPRGALGRMVEGVWQPNVSLVPGIGHATPSLAYALATPVWPRVEWLTNHAGNVGNMVHALLAQQHHVQSPLRGLVVAATGAGTLSLGMEEALAKARESGVKVWVCSRTAWGEAMFHQPKDGCETIALSPAKACVALTLALMASDEKA